jgi:hypothetical protein
VPRETSNVREVRFGDVVILKQILVLHRKNSWKLSEYLFDLRSPVHVPQVISKLSLVLNFLIWATENPRKNQPLSAVLFWHISATICVCLSIAFFFSSFDHETFGEVATVVYALYVVGLSWNLNQKGWFTIMLMLMLLIELCGVLYEGSSLGMPTHPKKYPRGTSVKAWGCPRGTPSSSAKIRSPFNTLFLLLHALCVFLGALVVFAFSFLLFCLLQ